MPSKLSKEFTELLNEVLGETHENEPWHTRLSHIAKELADVVAVVLDALDEENQVSELATFKNEVEADVMAAIDRASVKPPRWVRAVLPTLIKNGVDWAVDEIVNSGQTVDQWAKQTLVPILKEADGAILHWVLRLTRNKGE